MRYAKELMAAAVLVLVAGCGPTWSSSELKTAPTAAATVTGAASTSESTPTDASRILVTEDDITDRAYAVLGDLKVTVNKTTIFNQDPTRELVDAELRKEAAKIGADAVILVRYGTVGISFTSWGSLDGQGRAIAFTD